ncbi:hypothetical protein EMELA_v1c03730 [Mesoplasma melaleucae]|uniref:Pentapeptide repeat-containing protein n=2 Tax=Mesoplasma melaleucae TaxID=81459 RepID=A0A2K8NVR3_9MOLU|nr:hypothetical protein EMELA_v1c03730 [Mesoplasma melaleucae]
MTKKEIKLSNKELNLKLNYAENFKPAAGSVGEFQRNYIRHLINLYNKGLSRPAQYQNLHFKIEQHKLELELKKNNILEEQNKNQFYYDEEFNEKQFKNFDFSNIDIKDLDLNSSFTNCNFSGCFSSLQTINVNDAYFENCDFSNSKLIGLDTSSGDKFGVGFKNCKFINTDFSFAKLEDSTFEKCVFENINLNNADIWRKKLWNIWFV